MPGDFHRKVNFKSLGSDRILPEVLSSCGISKKLSPSHDLREGTTYSVGDLWCVENEVEEPLVERIVLADHLCNGRREKRLL